MAALQLEPSAHAPWTRTMFDALDGHQQTLERQTAVLTKLAAAAAG